MSEYPAPRNHKDAPKRYRVIKRLMEEDDYGG
jgi:hypothetical protein